MCGQPPETPPYPSQNAHGPGEADAGRDRAALGGALGDRRRVPLRAASGSIPRSSPSTRRRQRCPAPSTWARCSATARPTRWPATSGCAAAPSTTRWVGTTTGWPPSVGCRTTTACAATRRSRTRPSSRRRSAATHRLTTRPSRSRGRTSSSCATSSTAIDEAAFEELFRRLGLSVDWTLLYTTIDDLSRRTSQATFLHNLARGEAYSAEAPTVWDVDDRTAVAQAEIEDRERPGAYHVVAFDGPGRRRVDRDHSPRADRQLRGDGRPSRRRALPVARRVDRAHPAVRRGGPRRRPPAGAAGQGNRHRHGVHVRRHDRRDVVARAGAADAQRHRPRRTLQRHDSRRGCRPTRRGRRTSRWPDAPSSRRRRRPSSSFVRQERPSRRPEADHPSRSSSTSAAPGRWRS